ncbi:uncharacterized protein LOC121250011 [Juglans microcarpa x Juglans regia]|uniref:uncharacterized protein LOC121250011 n=1 Tax=Juglans microcarpa x Juglans regia TaxID=2249226 RepID=UPI001B7EA8FF|nr:uncharacterized protein LOC121250011 [Juglans microcarpa x Juglans regia]
MGCCTSTTRSQPDQKTGLFHQKFQEKSPIPVSEQSHVRDLRSPPQPPVEEEFVKEVLSETPVVSKRQNPIPAEEKETQFPIETKGLCLIHEAETEEVSEFSQISESLSLSTTTTTTITDKKEEDEAISKRSIEVGQNVLHRAQTRGPRKRPNTTDLASRRVIPTKGSSEVRTRRLDVRTAGARRDPGEGPGRRSRSPATRTASGVGRSPGKGMGRTCGQSLESGVQCKQSTGAEEELKEGNLQVGNESLENPLVSLECFIFL